MVVIVTSRSDSPGNGSYIDVSRKPNLFLDKKFWREREREREIGGR
jgi:hypothetical protein